jgi:putative ABC transport system permease protein
MGQQDRLWTLMARKLSGEATQEELAELARYQQQHPESTYALQVLADLWRSHNKDENKEESASEAALQRHLTRMALRDPVPGSTNPATTGPNDPQGQPQQQGQPHQQAQPHPLAHSDPHRQSRRRMSLDLLGNYFKIARRSIYRNKGFSAINISGLAIGLASAIVLLLWIRNELTFDQFHRNRDRVYQALSRGTYDGQHIGVQGRTPMIMGPALAADYPRQIETIVRMNWVGAFIFTAADKHIQTQGYLCDAGFFKLFSFPLLEGDPATALNGPHKVVLTQRLAKKLFGDADPLGRRIKIDSTAGFVVSAVMKDQPPNTQFTFEYLVPWSYTDEIHWGMYDWKKNTIATYVLLRPGITETEADKSIRMIIHAHAPEEASEVFLHPMRKWHLYSNWVDGKPTGGEINFVRMLAVIAAFILLIACINYMNLSTARSIRRAREVGIRKVVGAGRGSLIGRFLGESVLIAVMAGILALGIVALALPWFRTLVMANLAIPYKEGWFWLAGGAFIAFTGLLAGSYPAFYLSAFRPVNILRGHFRTIHALVTPRRILVIFQFAFAITFIICTVVIYREFNYVWNRDSGYNKKGLGFVYVKGDMLRNYAAIRKALLASGTVTDITRTNSPISEIWTWDDNYEWTGKKPQQQIQFVEYRTDGHFTSTMGLRLLAGRDIDAAEYHSDSTALLLSETAAKCMGFTNPIGQIVHTNGLTLHVVGVINDFVSGSMFNPILPIVVQGPTSWFGTISFRFNDQNDQETNLRKLQAIFEKYNPNYPFEYFSGEKYVAAQMQDQEHFGDLAALFAGMAIFISCLGLFGLSAYMAESRLREVGVRKVLGASIMRLTALLSKDFLILVLIAFAIASPIAWWFMRQWLNDIPYHVELNWWIFALTGLLSLAIAAGTVGFQAIRAALRNPALVLRTD